MPPHSVASSGRYGARSFAGNSSGTEIRCPAVTLKGRLSRCAVCILAGQPLVVRACVHRESLID